MKTFLQLALLSIGGSLPLCAAQPWRELSMPTVAEAAAAFAQPPREYGAIHWAIWGGQLTRERILADIENMYANGTYVIMINNSRGLRPKYFTPEYLDLVKFTVEECKKRGMKVWIENEAGYPDGMAGGAISRDYPELGMQALVADARYTVAAGQTLKIPVPPDTVGILGYTRGSNTTAVLPIPADGRFTWTAPNPGASEVVFVRHVFRSSPTRFTNRADNTNDKDSLYSLIDYLNPDATRAFIKSVHEVYEKLVGEEFGKTILGFRGDEPDFTGFMPWTPKLLETFQRVKGYDLQPYLAQFFAPEFTPEVLRAKADYWDVWSAMFRDNFFKVQEDWCKARNMDYMVHLNHEEIMLDLAHGEDLIRNEGSFFRAMRYVGLPGVDNLNQTGPGITADFPKLAASAAHVYGRPQAWTEQGGGLRQSGKFVTDHELVRGINFLQIRGVNNTPPENPEMGINPAAATSGYVNRASYLLASGRPAAQVALFHPTDSMWMGDKESDDVTVRLVTQLLEHQIDFDHIDADSLATVCTLEDGGLKNLSGQVYRAVIVPTSTVIDRRVLDRLRAFASAGGKVVFVGRTPTLVVGRSFLQADSTAPDLSFATLEPKAELTDRVIAALPAPDVKLSAACAPIKYTRRQFKDGDVYFFFNESDATQSRTAALAGRGDVQVWDATSGKIHPLAGTKTSTGTATLELTLAPYESRFVVVGPGPSAKSAEPFPSATAAKNVSALDDGWAITLGEKQAGGTLKSWEEMGAATFADTALYRHAFTATAPGNGSHIYVDLGNVHEHARVSVNGTALETKSWPPYVWDVTALVKAGANALEVQVRKAPPAAAPNFRGNAAPPAATSGPRGFSPTGVPGGLGSEVAGGRGGRGGNPQGGGGRGGPPTPPATSGLIGPVRVIAQ